MTTASPTGERRFRHLAIRASAGSGKTFRLSNRFIALLAAGESPERIFATTFTRKAAGEILERVLERLADAVLDDDARRELAGFIGLDEREFDAAHAGRLLTRVASHLHAMRVSTLDSFFSRLASSFGYELSLPPNWRLTDPRDEEVLLGRAVDGLLATTDAGRADVGEWASLFRMLGRGDVKRSIASQLLDLVRTLHRTFLEAPLEDAWRLPVAGRRLQARQLTDALEQLRVAPLATTKTGRPNSHWRRARDRALECAERSDWRGFVESGLAAKIVLGATQFHRSTITETVVACFEPLIEHARHVLTKRVADQTLATHELLARYYARIAELRQRTGQFGFSDIARILAGASFLGHLDTVYLRLDASLRHLLLDEFQDTSLVQWQVLEPIAREVASAGDDQSFFCVGDVKQAIYGWRGGVPEIFEWIDRRLPGVDWEPMDTSYRSAPEVIAVVNRVFQSGAALQLLADDAAGAESWLEDFAPHDTAVTGPPGYVALSTAPRTETPGEQPLTTLIAAADHIVELHRAQPTASIGVLVRRNQAVSRLIFELRRRGVAASEEGGNPLTDSPAVALIVSLLRWIEHPGDRVARYHVARSPLAKRAVSGGGSLERWASGLRHALFDDGYAVALEPIVASLSAVVASRDRDRLQQLLELADAWQTRATGRIDDFLRFVELTRVESPSAAPVRVMNVHQSKGLQFDITVLPELDQRFFGQTPPILTEREHPLAPIDRVICFPNKTLRSLSDAYDRAYAQYREREVRENLSVLYVALTRAKREMHLLIAPSAENERSIPKTFAGILRLALIGGDRAEPDAMLFEHGTVPTSPASTDEIEPSSAHFEAEETLEFREVRDGERAPEREPLWQSPSTLIGAGPIATAELLELGDKSALERGSLLHACFERIEWLENSDRDRIEGTLPNADLRREWKQCLEHDAVREVLSETAWRKTLPYGIRELIDVGDLGTRVEVLAEEPFAVRNTNGFLAGSFDRLVLVSRGGHTVFADVIDFKTDHTSADALTRYAPQMRAYRRACSRLFDLDGTAIRSRLCFVSLGALIPVP